MTKTVKDAIRKNNSKRRALAPFGVFAFRLVMMLLVLGSIAAGLAFLWKRGLSDPRFQMDGETVSLAGAIRECPESIAELEAIGRRFSGRSLLDPWLVGDMEKAYGGNRWIRQVTRIRRRFPNRIDLQFLLRLPAAQIWHENKYWLVDDEAALLPVAGSPRGFDSLPEIVGVTPDIIGNRPQSGGIWNDRAVGGALGIIRSFWGSPLGEAVPIRRVVVDAGSYQGKDGKLRAARHRYEVVAENGSVIRWGTYNPGDLAGELTNAEKLWNLLDLMRREEAATPGAGYDIRTSLPGYLIVPAGR